MIKFMESVFANTYPSLFRCHFFVYLDSFLCHKLSQSQSLPRRRRSLTGHNPCSSTRGRWFGRQRGSTPALAGLLCWLRVRIISAVGVTYCFVRDDKNNCLFGIDVLIKLKLIMILETDGRSTYFSIFWFLFCLPNKDLT